MSQLRIPAKAVRSLARLGSEPLPAGRFQAHSLLRISRGDQNPQRGVGEDSQPVQEGEGDEGHPHPPHGQAQVRRQPAGDPSDGLPGGVTAEFRDRRRGR